MTVLIVWLFLWNDGGDFWVFPRLCSSGRNLKGRRRYQVWSVSCTAVCWRPIPGPADDCRFLCALWTVIGVNVRVRPQLSCVQLPKWRVLFVPPFCLQSHRLHHPVWHRTSKTSKRCFVSNRRKRISLGPSYFHKRWICAVAQNECDRGITCGDMTTNVFLGPFL